MSEWKPIESAPKDGTSVLGYFPAGAKYVARADVSPIFWEKAMELWTNPVSGHFCFHAPPTHWMPLPPPPGSET